MIEYIYEGGDTSLFNGVKKRGGVVYCPYCRFSYDIDNEIGQRCNSWYDTKEKVIQVIMQHYKCRKDGIIILSRCIECGEISWVHRNFILCLQDIERFGILDKDKIEEEKKKRMKQACEDWLSSLCRTCKNLDHTNEAQYNYAYGVWVDCITRKDGNKIYRSGSPKKECEYYERK